MKPFFSIVILLQLVGTVCLGQWQRQQSGTLARLNAVSFQNRLEGFVVGDSGVILRTSNGGASWVRRTSGTNFRLWDVEITGPGEAWAVGGRSTVDRSGADSSVILRTTDGGSTWVPLQQGSRYGCFFDCDFTSRLRGTIAGCYRDSSEGWYGWPVLLQTTDGGISWSSQSPSPTLNRHVWPAVDFESATDGWLVEIVGSAGYYPRVLRTTDGGTTWTICAEGHGWMFDVNRLHSSRSGLAIAAGSDNIRRNAGPAYGNEFAGYRIGGRMLITSDGGLTWSIRSFDSLFFPSAFSGVYCLDSNTACVAGVHWEGEPGTYVPRPLVLRTTNSGATWSHWVGTLSGGLNGITFVDGLSGWAVGDSGIILHTTSGGATSVDPTMAGEKPLEMLLLQNFPNPFNPSTTIRYGVPRASHVTLTVHTMLGQEVARLVNEQKAAGYHDVVFRSDGLASGVYFTVLEAGGSVATGKMILLR